MEVGSFGFWQPLYAACGVATFPVEMVDGRKKPVVGNYLKMGLPASRELRSRYSHCEAFGIALKQNKLTVLDVDTNDERVLIKAMERHGQSPFIVESGSGNRHAYYRHNGERRQIRPYRGLPIDILGAGYVVAPHSQLANGVYKIIQGTLDDLRNLPPMQGLDTPDSEENVGAERVRQGGRRNALRDFLRLQARFCDTVDDLTDVAFGFANDQMDRHDGHEFSDAEVRKEARSIWKWTEDGNNFAGVGRSLVLRHDTIDRVMQLGPDALFLYLKLRRHNWNQPFPVSNAMKGSMGGGPWTLRRLQKVRQSLIDAKVISPVRQASSHKGAALFRWVSDNAHL